MHKDFVSLDEHIEHVSHRGFTGCQWRCSVVRSNTLPKFRRIVPVDQTMSYFASPVTES